MNITFVFWITICLCFSVNVEVSLDHFLNLKKKSKNHCLNKVSLFYNPSKKLIFYLLLLNMFVFADHEPAVEVLHQCHQIDHFLSSVRCSPLLSKQYFLMHFVDIVSILLHLLRDAGDDKLNFWNTL